MARKVATKKPFIKEAEIQSQIIHYLQKRKILFWRQSLGGVAHSINGRMIFKKNPMKGFPDIAGLYKTYFFTIEVKSEKGRLSVEQKSWITELTRNGGFHCTANDISDVIELFLDIDESTKPLGETP